MRALHIEGSSVSLASERSFIPYDIVARYSFELSTSTARNRSEFFVLTFSDFFVRPSVHFEFSRICNRFL